MPGSNTETPMVVQHSGIETKYTEPFSSRVCNGPRSWAVKAWPDNHYLPNAASVLRKTRTNQLWRNVLLVAAIRRHWGYHEGLVLVLGLAGDPHIVEAVETLSSVNAHPETLVCMASLEELISASKSEVELVDGVVELTPLRSIVHRPEPYIGVPRQANERRKVLGAMDQFIYEVYRDGRNIGLGIPYEQMSVSVMGTFPPRLRSHATVGDVLREASVPPSSSLRSVRASSSRMPRRP